MRYELPAPPADPGVDELAQVRDALTAARLTVAATEALADAGCTSVHLVAPHMVQRLTIDAANEIACTDEDGSIMRGASPAAIAKSFRRAWPFCFDLE